MNRRYSLTDQTIVYDGVILHRIKALRTFHCQLHVIKKGQLGGYIQSETNLAQADNAWVADHAKVYGDAKVLNNAYVCHEATVRGNACISDNAQVIDNAIVEDFAHVYNNAMVIGNAVVAGRAKIFGDAEVKDDAYINGDVSLDGFAYIDGTAKIRSNNDHIGISWFTNDVAHIHAFLCSDNNIRVTWHTAICCFRGTLQAFDEYFTNPARDTPLKTKQYELFVRLVKCKLEHGYTGV